MWYARVFQRGPSIALILQAKLFVPDVFCLNVLISVFMYMFSMYKNVAHTLYIAFSNYKMSCISNLLVFCVKSVSFCVIDGGEMIESNPEFPDGKTVPLD